jgi:hypothetical protein
MADGKDFRLADEIRHIQRCAARQNGRIVTVGQLILFSTQTGDAWLLYVDGKTGGTRAILGYPTQKLEQAARSS